MKQLAGLSKGTLAMGAIAALYLLVVIAKFDEPYNVQRWLFLVGLIVVAAAFHFKLIKQLIGVGVLALGLFAAYEVATNLGEGNNTRRIVGLLAIVAIAGGYALRWGSAKMDLSRFFKYAHLFLAIIYFWGAAFGKWAKRGDPDEGALSSMGGTGYGIVAVVLGIAFLVLAVMRLEGRTKVLPGLGVEQLTVILGVAAWMNILAFVVGWLATFEAGTGWGVVVAYFPASLIPQLGLITLSGAEPPTGIDELDVGKRRVFSAVAAVAAVGVALFPFLAWLTSRGVELSALEGKSGEGTLSGPRLGYILLIFGAVVAFAALLRLRPQGLAEPGPSALVGHVLLAAGLVAVLIPLATLISILRLDIDVNPGIGLWLGLVAGLVLVVLAMAENRARGAVGV